jgi:hypothetical protein
MALEMLEELVDMKCMFHMVKCAGYMDGLFFRFIE